MSHEPVASGCCRNIRIALFSFGVAKEYESYRVKRELAPSISLASEMDSLDLPYL